ncbi:MAG: ATP-binding protein [Gammaproteobacteria bacterium]
MTAKVSDVTLHIDEETSEADRKALREQLLQQKGVISATYNNEKSHLIVVEYNPDIVNSTTFLKVVEQFNMHAELIGM